MLSWYRRRERQTDRQKETETDRQTEHTEHTVLVFLAVSETWQAIFGLISGMKSL